MPNILDYLFWRGDLKFDQSPFNPVDGLILSCLVSLKLPFSLPPTLGQAAVSDNSDFAQALSRSPRFADMQLYRFEEKFSEAEEMQFAAVTILTGDQSAFVSFRGTDSTLTGWKENFNMSYMREVPAQREATAYINRVADELKLPLRVGGHSKGGNLAGYAAGMCLPRVQRRIETVYNFDGPGLNPEAAQSDGYRAIESRIETYLPQSSIVGILLTRPEHYQVIRSSAEGAMQHNPFTWQVTPSGFETLSALDPQSLYADRTIRDWLSGLSSDQRRTFVNALYSIAESSGARKIDDIDWPSSLPRMLETFGDLDPKTKASIILTLGKLAGSAALNLNAN